MVLNLPPSSEISVILILPGSTFLFSVALSLLVSLVGQIIKNLPAMQETQVQFLGQEDPLEKGMATHSSILPSDSTLIQDAAAAKSLQSCPTLCDPLDCSTPGLPVHHQLPELTQTHVH